VPALDDAAVVPGDEPVETAGQSSVASVAPAGVAPGSSRRRWRRRVVFGVLVVFALALADYAFSFYQVWSTGRSDQARKVDAIIVLGAAQYDGRPSPQLAARLDHALALWHDGYAGTIVVTGGKQPGDRFTEATASANYLIAHGVPDTEILREVQGASSWESLEAAARFLKPKQLTRVLLVSDPYHSERIRRIAEELGLSAYVSPTRTSPVKGKAAFAYMLHEAGGVAIARFTGFRRLVSLSS
jgi:uncharacterized SAM-binding protein YcdF (DUF218 family)